MDGRDAISYLEGEGDYADRGKSPFPSVIFTDIHMPKWMDSPSCTG